MSSASQQQRPSEEERFHQNIVASADLIHELVTYCWEAGHNQVPPTIVNMAEKYLKSYDKHTLIDGFITKSYKYWDEIRLRNQQFFIEHAKDVFDGLPFKQVNAFSILFTSKKADGTDVIDDEDKDAIWNYFSAMVKICIKYVHKRRKMVRIEGADGVRLRYTVKYQPCVQVKEQAKLWEITLSGTSN